MVKDRRARGGPSRWPRPPGSAGHPVSAGSPSGWALWPLGLLVGAIWLLATARPPLVPESPSLFSTSSWPSCRSTWSSVRRGLRSCSASGSALAALLVRIAALEAANALRVLSSGRQITEPPPGDVRGGPSGPGPGRDAQRWSSTSRRRGRSPRPRRRRARRRRVRCTVLHPGARRGGDHRVDARLAAEPDRARQTGSSSSRTTARTRPCGSPARAASRSSRRSATPQHKAGALNQALARLLPDGRRRGRRPRHGRRLDDHARTSSRSRSGCWTTTPT